MLHFKLSQKPASPEINYCAQNKLSTGLQDLENGKK